MDDKELNQAIGRAKQTAKRKAARIAKREKFDASMAANIDPTRNTTTQGMNRSEKEAFLGRLRAFNNRKFDIFKSEMGQLISSEQWNRYKDAERRVNAFVKRDMKPYLNKQMPEGDWTVKEFNDLMRKPRKGLIQDDASGTSMLLFNRKPKEVMNVESLTDALEAMLLPGYKDKKLNLAKNNFREMVNRIGDSQLIEDAIDLTDEQFWVLWNYTKFANDVSFVYESLKLGMSINKPSLSNSMAKAGRYVNWASNL